VRSDTSNCAASTAAVTGRFLPRRDWSNVSRRVVRDTLSPPKKESGAAYQSTLSENVSSSSATHYPGRKKTAYRPFFNCVVYARLLLTTSNTSLDSSPQARMRSSSAFISACRALSYLRQRVNGANWREAICGLKPFN